MMWYLASPYSLYPEGRQAAADDIAEQAALLFNAGVKFISPICHSHPIALAGVDDCSHEAWMEFCRPMMHACEGLIVCKLDGWHESLGVREEMGEFQQTDRPIIFMEPGEIPIGL